MRSLPSDGYIKRLYRILEGKWSFSAKDVSRWMRVKESQAGVYLHKLRDEGKIVYSHVEGNRIFYKVVR